MLMLKKGLFWGIVLSLLLGLCLILEAYIFNGASFHFSLSFDDYLNTFLMAGIAEEIVFRGLILQELNKRFSFLEGECNHGSIIFSHTLSNLDIQ